MVRPQLLNLETERLLIALLSICGRHPSLRPHLFSLAVKRCRWRRALLQPRGQKSLRRIAERKARRRLLDELRWIQMLIAIKNRAPARPRRLRCVPLAFAKLGSMRPASEPIPA